MKQLGTIREEDIFSRNEVIEIAYEDRRAVKAIIVDADGNIAMVGKTKSGYRLLPGGGVESGESDAAAITRECLEEIGCLVVVEQAIGEVEDYRARDARHQTTACYLGRVVGAKGVPRSQQTDELDLEVSWVHPSEVLRLLKEQAVSLPEKFYNGHFNTRMQALFLEEALRSGFL